jgi:hypothetical protein
MAGISKIEELQARKRALVTESEICREAFSAELDSLKSHAAGFVHRFDKVRTVGPWLMLAGPLVFPLARLVFRRREQPVAKPSKTKGVFAAAMVGLRLYRKYGPLVRSMVTQFQAKRRAAGGRATGARH